MTPSPSEEPWPPAPNGRSCILNPSPTGELSGPSAGAARASLSKLRFRVAVSAPQLAVLRVPKLQGEGVADRRRGGGGRRLQQQQQQERHQRDGIHGQAERKERGGRRLLAGAEDAAAAGTGSLTSPERGSLGRGGGGCGERAGARRCGTVGIPAGRGRWIVAPAVCPTSGSHDTSLVSTDEGISVIARGQKETNRVIEWRRDLLAWGSGKASQSRRYFELATRGGRRGTARSGRACWKRK